MLGDTRKTHSAREAKAGGEEHAQMQRAAHRCRGLQGGTLPGDGQSPGQDGQRAQSPRSDGGWAEEVEQITADREGPCVGPMR